MGDHKQNDKKCQCAFCRRENLDLVEVKYSKKKKLLQYNTLGETTIMLTAAEDKR